MTNDKDYRIEELEQENRRLREELRRMHVGLRCSGITLAPSLAATGASGSGTFLGLEELILQVNRDLTIGYINSPMGKLLGISERRSVIGDPLEKWDRGQLGPGVLRSVVDSARATKSTVVVERVCPELDPAMLPASCGPRPACPPVLRLVANEVKGRVELVIQDITRLRWLENTFSRYVAPEVINQMLNRPQESFMQMERRQATILFADLRGFTRITQQLQPQVLQEMINQFLSHMVACINKWGGLVDKFIGDEVMAIFGAPLLQEDHALRALLTALDMQQVHLRTEEAWARAGRPTAGVGIGVTTGEVIIGNLGTDTRMEYTAIGHSVNLAARLCAAAGAGEILANSDCYQAAAEAMKSTKLENLPRLKFSPRGKQEFKNIDQPVTVLAVSAV